MTINRLQLIIALFFCLFFIEKTTAQNIETITKQKPVTVSGNLGISANSYYSNVFNPNNSPYGYAINGNVNISLYGLYNIPITIFMTNLSRGYGANPTPLTNLGFAPTYKRFTFYGGWSTVQFSQYTLAGAPFVGGGFEYKGKWLRLGAVGGNFQQAYGDTVALARPLGYSRMGWGAKLGFGNDANFIDFTAFKAKEDSNSLPFRLKAHETRPKENLAVGTNFKTSFFKRRLSFDGELAVSAYNSDIGAQPIDLEEAAPQYSAIQKVFQPRFSTTFYYAGATSLGWQGRNFQSKLQYKRVSRDYRSLGALYVQGNLESYTLNTGWTMFKNKLRFNFTGGIQHDELPLFGSSVTVKDRLLMFATAGAYARKLQVDLPVFTFRRIGSGSLSFNPVQWYGLDLSYSNFLTDQQVSSRLLLDTARTAQASQSFMVMNRLTFARTTVIHNIITVYNHSIFDNNATNNFRLPSAIGTNTLGNMTYSLSFPKKRFSINSNLNYSESQFGSAPITYMGAMIGGGKSFLKGKLSTSANIGYGVNKSPTGKSGNVNFSFNSALQATPKQSFNVSIVMLNNKAEQALNPNVGEFRGNIGYNYNF